MVPCLHQGSIYIKRKLWVWGGQKCIPLVGTQTPLTCAGHQTTPSQGRRYRAENGNLRKLGWTYRHGSVFAPRQYSYQKEATGMERAEMYFPSWCKNPTYLCRQTTPSQGRWYRAENGNLRKLGGGPIAMVPCLHQGNIYIIRKLLVWREEKCIPLFGVKTPLTCAGRQTTLSQERRYRVENENLLKLGWTYRHGTVFAPSQYLYQKEATGMERAEMYFPSWCKNRTYLCGPSNYSVSREVV